jgi:hypothetical protein
MCGPTSEAQDRVIEQDPSEEMSTMTMTPEPFLSAEIEYRQHRAAEQYAKGPRRRHWVPRRPSLKLPHPRRRPLSVA